jgi:outer membrane immunogenic protein
MKRTLLIAALAVGGISSSQAADLEPRTYAKAPAYVAPIFNWSGFYIGADAGYGWGN